MEAALATYIEQLPSPELRPFVECIWYSPPTDDVAFDIIPDGCVDVCFVLSEHDPRVLLFGTTTQTSAYEMEPGAPYFGVRFRPGRASLFMRESIADLTDTRFRVPQFLGSTAEEFLVSTSFHTRRERLERLLRAALSDARPEYGKIVAHAVSAINLAHGDIRIRDLAAHSSLSERQLERRFLEEVGITPKFYARIQRFRSVLNHLEDPAEPDGPKIADLAVMHGYTDQSHLLRDFKRFAHGVPRLVDRTRVSAQTPAQGSRMQSA